MLMKESHTHERPEGRAEARLRELLSAVPIIHEVEVEREVGPKDHTVDFAVRLKVNDREHLLLCEVKANGQPRYVRDAIHQLSYVRGALDDGATLVFLAPFLSQNAQALCEEAGVGYADFEGNCRLAFGGVFIERHVDTRPSSIKRELRSMFSPKAAQVLRRLLREPARSWKVVDLAEAAKVSLGQVSNVRRALLQRDWASADDSGLRLSAPGELLDTWRDNYAAPAGERIGAYTPLHGRLLEEALSRATLDGEAKIVLAANSAAKWLAPYLRNAQDTVYADQAGWQALRRHIDVGPISRGANLEIVVLEDQGPLLDAVELQPGRVVTSPVQTYLDLWASGERGQEAAEHLRDKMMAWPT
jgi:hypothetical protein